MDSGITEHLPPDLMQYGVAVVVIVVVLRLVLDFLLTWKNHKNGVTSILPPMAEHCRRCDSRLEKLAGQMNNLWDMHDKYNDDGSPKWYIPTTILKNIHKDLAIQYKCQKDMLKLLRESGMASAHHEEQTLMRYDTALKELEKLSARIEGCTDKIEKFVSQPRT
jgi:exonuclease VII small subunit